MISHCTEVLYSDANGCANKLNALLFLSSPVLTVCVSVTRQQEAILEDLVTDIPLEFDFLFSRSQAEVISGKQEGKSRLI